MNKKILQKFIAESGYCSRRRAEELIKNKEVFINGTVAEPGVRVDFYDEVKVGRKIVESVTRKIYIKLNKPQGYVCTNRRFQKEKSVFDLIKIEEKLFVVGRLDKNSRGLVVLTNDGDWGYKMTHPSFEKEKEYYIKTDNKEMEGEGDKIRMKFLQGIDYQGEVFRAKSFEQISSNYFKVILTEGKKRQLRKMFESLNMKIVDLKRTRVGDICLGDLKPGKYELLEEQGS